MTGTTTDTANDSTEREDSRLEIDDEYHCRECGIAIPFAAYSAGYERCPECVLEDTKDELVTLFGSLNSVEAAPARDTRSHLVIATDDVLGGFIKVFDDDRAEFVPNLVGGSYWDYVTENKENSDGGRHD